MLEVNWTPTPLRSRQTRKSVHKSFPIYLTVCHEVAEDLDFFLNWNFNHSSTWLQMTIPRKLVSLELEILTYLFHFFITSVSSSVPQMFVEKWLSSWNYSLQIFIEQPVCRSITQLIQCLLHDRVPSGHHHLISFWFFLAVVAMEQINFQASAHSSLKWKCKISSLRFLPALKFVNRIFLLKANGELARCKVQNWS